MIPFLLILNSKHHEILFQKWFASSFFFQFHFVILINFHPGVFHSSSVAILRNEKNIERQIHSKNIWLKCAIHCDQNIHENKTPVGTKIQSTYPREREKNTPIETRISSSDSDKFGWFKILRDKRPFKKRIYRDAMFFVVVGSSSRVKLLIWPCRCLSSVGRLPSVTCVTIIINQKHTYSCSVYSHLQMWTLFYSIRAVLFFYFFFIC